MFIYKKIKCLLGVKKAEVKIISPTKAIKSTGQETGKVQRQAQEKQHK